MNIYLVSTGTFFVGVVLAGFAFYDTAKHNHYGMPIPVGNLVPGDYKILSCVTSEDGESFAVMERTQDETIMCVDVTPLKAKELEVGKTLKL